MIDWPYLLERLRLAWRLHRKWKFDLRQAWRIANRT